MVRDCFYLMVSLSNHERYLWLIPGTPTLRQAQGEENLMVSLSNHEGYLWRMAGQAHLQAGSSSGRLTLRQAQGEGGVISK
jgi:hypothetical protein